MSFSPLCSMTHCKPPARHQAADRHIRDLQVNTAKHLAAKESDISFMSWWRPNLELIESDQDDSKWLKRRKYVITECPTCLY